MATQHDLSEVIAFLDEGHEYVGIKSERHPEGRTYRVPPPNAQTGLWLSTLAELGTVAASGGNLSAQDVADLTFDDDEEKPFYRRVLGSAYDEMVADKVSWPALQAIGKHAFLTFTMSQEMADLELQTALGKARSRTVPAPAKRTPAKRTAKRTGGSASPTASGGTRARTPAKASTRSSTSPTAPEPPVAASG